MTTTSNRPDTLDMLAQLTRPHQHAEAYTHEANGTTYTTRWPVTAPPLVDQLQHASPLTGGDVTGTGYGSRPAGNLEALDTLIRIDLEAARWVRDLGDDDPGTTRGCLQHLAGLYAGLPIPTHKMQREPGQPPTCCTRHHIDYDVRRWWSQARIVSGWDTPAWKPDNTCPLCGHRGTLRIRTTDMAALCTQCHETWDSDTIGLLAEHIRTENHDTEVQGA